MKNLPITIKLLSFSLLCANSNLIYAETISPANNIKYPANLKNWQVIGSSYRTDNDTQRVILGNPIALKASRSGQTNPWPKGSIIAKLVWKNKEHPTWKAAIVPGKFVHTEIMVKDSQKYPSTKGWGYARWIGESLKPYRGNGSPSQECYSCHTHVKNNDYIFTFPAKIP
jgi:hypothetical protein